MLFEKLIRPALHVQGAWREGFGFHFAVADADMKKDTNNNIEVPARLMEQLCCTWDALPLSIAIIQDNTSRACKKSENCHVARFQDDMDVVNILDNFLKSSC